MATKIHDIIIIGGGPAGLAAGIYAARARMDTLLVESLSVMGQLTMTSEIENYPGVDSVGGFELITKLKNQATKFGLECAQATVQSLSKETVDGQEIWSIETDSGTYKTISVIVATGATAKKLGIPGETKFIGSGVSYCGTCDAAFFREKDIIVIGGGDTAVEEALFLTKFGKKVTLIHRRDRLRATKILQERAFANDKLDFIWESTVQEIKGEGNVNGIVVKNVKTEELSEVSCDGVFIFVGWQPNTDFVDGVVDRNKQEAIVVNKEMNTSAKGIFAAGDCCEKLLLQVITACGDGATAAFSAQHYVDNVKGCAY